jgi:hypothetical protein
MLSGAVFTVTLWDAGSLPPALAVNVRLLGDAVPAGQSWHAAEIGLPPPIPSVTTVPVWPAQKVAFVHVYVTVLVGEPIKLALNDSGIGAGIVFAGKATFAEIEATVFVGTMRYRVQLLKANVSLPVLLAVSVAFAPVQGSVAPLAEFSTSMVRPL